MNIAMHNNYIISFYRLLYCSVYNYIYRLLCVYIVGRAHIVCGGVIASVTTQTLHNRRTSNQT